MLTSGAVDTVKFKRTWTEINNETVGFIVLIVSAGGKKINEIKIDPSWSTSLLCLFICRLNNLALFISLMQLPWVYWSSHKIVYQKPCNLETVYLQAESSFMLINVGGLGWEKQGWVSWTVLGRVSPEGACIASMDMGHAELDSLTHTLCRIISKLHSFLWNVNRQCLNQLNTKLSRSEWVQCWILFN